MTEVRYKTGITIWFHSDESLVKTNLIHSHRKQGFMNPSWNLGLTGKEHKENSCGRGYFSYFYCGGNYMGVYFCQISTKT